MSLVGRIPSREEERETESKPHEMIEANRFGR